MKFCVHSVRPMALKSILNSAPCAQAPWLAVITTEIFLLLSLVLEFGSTKEPAPKDCRDHPPLWVNCMFLSMRSWQYEVAVLDAEPSPSRAKVVSPSLHLGLLRGSWTGVDVEVGGLSFADVTVGHPTVAEPSTVVSTVRYLISLSHVQLVKTPVGEISVSVSLV